MTPHHSVVVSSQETCLAYMGRMGGGFEEWFLDGSLFCVSS